MDIDRVKQVASLAKLHLSEKEQEDSARKLAQILNHFEKMASVSTEGIEPLLTPTEIETFFREDAVKKEISTEELLNNAPASQGLLFKVPQAVG
ncbi:MAG: Asp-tRNA(Asn)/Glu-tRNA(Gln) amidotransferase subunit GatC [Bdellovibrionales bacterium]